MKKIIGFTIISVLILVVNIAAIHPNKIECNAADLKDELLIELRPDFKYDSSKMLEFTYGKKKLTKEIEVPLFIGEKYRFIFNTAGLPKDIEIKIYNRKHTNDKRKLLYSVEKNSNEHIYAFEPPRARKVYINYTVPECDEEGLAGCFSFLVGYK